MTRILSLLAGLLLALAAPATRAQSLPQHCDAKPKVHLLLVDQTEAYDETDKTRLADGISKMLAELPGRGRLDIYTVADRPGALTPEIQICVPGCGVGDGPACDDPLYRRHRQAFNGEIQRVMTRHVENAQARGKSELLRSLYFLSLEYEGRNVAGLTLFSDMIEYSDLNSTVSNFTPVTADQLIRKVKAKVAPGRAFGQAGVRVFGFGKRLGSIAREEAIRQAQAEAEQTSREYSRTLKGKTVAGPAQSRDTEMSTDSLKALSEFWYRYFNEPAKVQKTEIRLNY
jgi:hypothetical protein